MRALIKGFPGQVGRDGVHVFSEGGLICADLSDSPVTHDITDQDAVRAMVDYAVPDCVINSSAFHNLPRCEKESAMADPVNATARQRLAAVRHEVGKRLVHVTTDCNFGYGGTRPYTEEDLPTPLSVNGASRRTEGHFAATAARSKAGTDEILTPAYTPPLFVNPSHGRKPNPPCADATLRRRRNASETSDKHCKQRHISELERRQPNTDAVPEKRHFQNKDLDEMSDLGEGPGA